MLYSTHLHGQVPPTGVWNRDSTVFNNVYRVQVEQKGCGVAAIHCLPCPSTMSLSIPLGPKVDPMASTITSHAFMLLIIWGFPWEESVPSFSSIIGAF